MFNKKTLVAKLKEKKTLFIILSICLLYLILKSIIYSKGLVFFDEGIYVGIAKYFVHLGKAGYFESIRPLAISVLLMPLQFLSFNTLVTGRLLGLFLTIICIPIIYYATDRYFGKKAAVWSAFLFSVSVSILTFGGYILNDVPAYVLAFLGTAFVLDKKYFLGGFVIGVGFLFKFPVLIVIFPILIYILWDKRKEFS